MPTWPESSSTRCRPTPSTTTAAALHGRLGSGAGRGPCPRCRLLRSPTVADLMAACDGTLVHGDVGLLDRESLGLVVAADVDAARHRPALRGRRRHRARRPRRRRARRAARAPVDDPADALRGGAQRGVRPLAAGRPADRRPRHAAADRGAPSGGTMAAATALGRVEGRITVDVRAQGAGRGGARRRGRDATSTRSWGTGSSAAEGAVTPLMFEHDLVERAREASSAHRAARGRRGAHPASPPTRCSRAASPGSPCSATRRSIRGQARQLGVDIVAGRGRRPGDQPVARGVRRRVRTAAGAQGRDARDGVRPGRRPVATSAR